MQSWRLREVAALKKGILVQSNSKTALMIDFLYRIIFVDSVTTANGFCGSAAVHFFDNCWNIINRNFVRIT
jgi:hypothetical protein